MRIKSLVTIIIFIVLNNFFIYAQSTIFVNTSASGSNNGLSWADAYTSLQSALDAAASGDGIWVAKGTYLPSQEEDGTTDTQRKYCFKMVEGVSIYGGFAGTESAVSERTNYSNGGTNETILSGDFNNDDVITGSGSTLSITNNSENCYHVIYHIQSGYPITSSALLDGFTITGGNANGSANPWNDGGGLYNHGGQTPTINNCYFRGNRVSDNGAAIFNANADGINITNCTFELNLAADAGGAIGNYSTDAVITNCLFFDNLANSEKGGGIYNYGGSNPTITNCTIVKNHSVSGGGIYNNENSDPSVINSIIWGNTITVVGPQIRNYDGSDLTLSYSCIEGGISDGIYSTVNGSETIDGGGNIDSNPVFVGSSTNASHPYSLLGASLCVDAGNNSVNSQSTDIRGSGYDRKLAKTDGSAGTIDIGAYEYKYNDDTENFPLGAYSIGGTINDNPYCIAVDDNFNMIIGGTFEATADFDPGAGTFNIASLGDNDCFITKLAPDGSFEWAVGFGNASNDRVYAVDTDSEGNVYATGWFWETVDFDPDGTTELTSFGIFDCFFVKYSPEGSLIWAKQIGGTSSDYTMDMHIDKNDAIHLVGKFGGTVDFDPGAGISNLTATGSDAFFAKYDTDGGLVWAKNFGGAGYTQGNKITVDGDGNIILFGDFSSSTLDVDPAGGTTLTRSGSYETYFAKYNSSGVLQWGTNIGGADSDYSGNLDTDASGNVFIIGRFAGTINLNPLGTETTVSSNNSSTDFFFAKYSPNGILDWGYSIGSTSTDNGECIKVDQNGDCFITGSFFNTCDFDPSGVTYNLTSNGSGDFYLAKYSGDGNFIWANNFGDASFTDRGISLDTDATDRIYVSGYYRNTVDFDPGASTCNLTSNGQTDTFIAKYEGNDTDNGALPVELSAFSAYVNESSVNLIWQTTTEVNNYGFQVQRTKDKVQSESEWETIGFIKGHGTTNSPNKYEFTDSELHESEVIRYRLKQIDLDGMFEYSDVVEVEVNYLPTEFALEQNYPNPFNPATTIEYSLPGEENVELKIYDILGNEVKILVNGKQEAGFYKVNFNASNLASGLYIYRIQAGKFRQTRKMLLMK